MMLGRRRATQITAALCSLPWARVGQVVDAGVGVVLAGYERGDEHGVCQAVVTASCPSGVAGAA